MKVSNLSRAVITVQHIFTWHSCSYALPCQCRYFIILHNSYFCYSYFNAEEIFLLEPKGRGVGESSDLFHYLIISSNPLGHHSLSISQNGIRTRILLCKICYTATAIPFMYRYSFSGNFAASAPLSTFMCLWATYIFPGSIYIFPPAEQADPSWEYIIRSQTRECGKWDWGPDIPFLGIFVSNFRHFVFAV